MLQPLEEATLGRLAQIGHKVFLRQTLISGYYGLLRDHYWYPTMRKEEIAANADYFVAFMFKVRFALAFARAHR